ncbi:hypothetical protein WBJ53_29715 [Spirosoma sp. SC4-14]|uniref:hypothetical protein n=1 Tax=Spirosoma sp. SC4-14 TaxID=3128900 RepID=UPI0030CB2888
MKTIAQSLLAALLLSTAALTTDATAKPVNPVTTSSYKAAVYPSLNASKLHVVVERQPGQAMAVYLKDSHGNRLAQQLVNKKLGTFRFQFDLSDMQDGNYTVEVVSGNDVALYPVTLTTKPSQAVTRTLTLN